jgi:ribokinase
LGSVGTGDALTLRDVLCIGNLNFDISFHLAQLPDVHQKVRCENVTLSCGGSAGNTACWLASLGVETGVLGAVGDDVFGQAQLQDLVRYGVDTTLVKKVKTSGMSVILVEGETKRMIKYTGANQYKDLSDIPQVDHIHFSSNEKDTLQKVVNSTAGATLSWDPQELFFKEFLPFFDYVFMNEDDLKRETGEPLSTAAAKPLDVSTLIVTKNGGGCVIFDDTVMDVPSFNIEAVDSTGAGDAFDAGFIFGLHNKVTLKECGVLGTACASIKVQHRGARGGICSKEDVTHFLNSNPGTLRNSLEYFVKEHK